MDMYSDTRVVHVHSVHPGWIRPCTFGIKCVLVKMKSFQLHLNLYARRDVSVCFRSQLLICMGGSSFLCFGAMGSLKKTGSRDTIHTFASLLQL